MSMKNNGRIEISETKPSVLLRNVEKIPGLHIGIPLVEKAIQVVGKSTKTILGGIGYSPTSIHVYIIQNRELPWTIMGRKTYVGAFIRYDDVRRAMVVRGVIYVPNDEILMVFDKLLPKAIIHSMDTVDEKLIGIIRKYRQDTETVNRKMSEAGEVEIDADDAFHLLEGIYHNTGHPDSIVDAFERKGSHTVWDLYLEIAKHYAKVSNTPNMQWSNICTAEKLLEDPAREVDRAFAYKMVNVADYTRERLLAEAQ